MTPALLASCIIISAQTYDVPPGVLLGIMQVEGGRVGQEVRNTNGSHDLGIMQINTIWLPELSERWGVSESTARKWIRDDGCANIAVASWILRQRINITGSLWEGIAGYHSFTPHIGRRYAKKVADAMRRYGLGEGKDILSTDERRAE